MALRVGQVDLSPYVICTVHPPRKLLYTAVLTSKRPLQGTQAGKGNTSSVSAGPSRQPTLNICPILFREGRTSELALIAVSHMCPARNC